MYLQPAFFILILAFASGAFSAPASNSPTAFDIVRRSAKSNAADWNSQPQYGHRERNITIKLGSNGEIKARIVKTYEVSMIDGSPYNRLIEIDDKPLSAAQQEQELTKLNREIRLRRNESSGARQQRLAKYNKDRAEERLLMEQMTTAFKFEMVGEQRVDGVDCYVLNAEPDPNYKPAVEKARVLTGMKGKLYIDKAQYHWVKVEAEVISPVEFGFFVAKVRPGTKFELEQAAVGDAWLPKRFSQSVNASVLGIYSMRSEEQEFYSDYHHIVLEAKVQQSKR